MDISIRRVASSDLDAVAEIEAQCFPQAEAASRAAFAERISVFPESFFVAEDNGTIIGFINGCVINDTRITDELFEDAAHHVPTGEYQTIFGLDVLPAYRQQGIAAMLMRHLIDVSKQRGRRGVLLTCKDKLLHYYKKFGFENMGVSQSAHGGALWYDMILRF